ncbi:hypothetical protein CCUS01_06246 [Colletotrichum cuscutae]|uniref:Uncharacterized protein n=1 Tax=Colletotrichum cuscutae TaxID=1209917 RepID=A0AAI9V8U5_9PEZI|nr:hypothetical protein CCUS01_06246 [Colletotrichum cuscutae]
MKQLRRREAGGSNAYTCQRFANLSGTRPADGLARERGWSPTEGCGAPTFLRFQNSSTVLHQRPAAQKVPKLQSPLGVPVLMGPGTRESARPDEGERRQIGGKEPWFGKSGEAYDWEPALGRRYLPSWPCCRIPRDTLTRMLMAQHSALTLGTCSPPERLHRPMLHAMLRLPWAHARLRRMRGEGHLTLSFDAGRSSPWLLVSLDAGYAEDASPRERTMALSVRKWLAAGVLLLPNVLGVGPLIKGEKCSAARLKHFSGIAVWEGGMRRDTASRATTDNAFTESVLPLPEAYSWPPWPVYIGRTLGTVGECATLRLDARIGRAQRECHWGTVAAVTGTTGICENGREGELGPAASDRGIGFDMGNNSQGPWSGVCLLLADLVSKAAKRVENQDREFQPFCRWRTNKEPEVRDLSENRQRQRRHLHRYVSVTTLVDKPWAQRQPRFRTNKSNETTCEVMDSNLPSFVLLRQSFQEQEQYLSTLLTLPDCLPSLRTYLPCTLETPGKIPLQLTGEGGARFIELEGLHQWLQSIMYCRYRRLRVRYLSNLEREHRLQNPTFPHFDQTWSARTVYSVPLALDGQHTSKKQAKQSRDRKAMSKKEHAPISVRQPLPNQHTGQATKGGAWQAWNLEARSDRSKIPLSYYISKDRHFDASGERTTNPQRKKILFLFLFLAAIPPSHFILSLEQSRLEIRTAPT